MLFFVILEVFAHWSFSIPRILLPHLSPLYSLQHILLPSKWFLYLSCTSDMGLGLRHFLSGNLFLLQSIFFSKLHLKSVTQNYNKYRFHQYLANSILVFFSPSIITIPPIRNYKLLYLYTGKFFLYFSLY